MVLTNLHLLPATVLIIVSLKVRLYQFMDMDKYVELYRDIPERQPYKNAGGNRGRKTIITAHWAAAGSGYVINDPNYRFLSTGRLAGQNNYSDAAASYLHSFLSQAEYDYKEKYFLTGTLRRDGSSVFGPESRFGWFPAVGAAWRMTEENFMMDSKWLTELKLRGSWGKTGFDGNTHPNNQYTLYRRWSRGLLIMI